MLSPEVWNFQAPKHKISTYGSKGASEKVLEEIGQHYFNHSVTVVLPDTVFVPKDLNTDFLNDSLYYLVRQFPVNKFLNKQFIESFIKSGQLTALSVGTCIDTDDCVAVTPSGFLVLNLLKETYQSLGLEASQSAFSTERYVVKIDLKNPSFIPGKNNYERAVKCLTELVPLQMDFIMAWEPSESQVKQQVCPSSLAAYISSLGLETQECVSKLKSSFQCNVKLPSLQNVDPPEILEWLGAVTLGVDMSREDPVGEYLSTYRGPLDSEAESGVCVLTFLGLFTTKQILNYFSVFRSYVKNRTGVSWAAMHVQGFADAPVSWGLQEHTYHGDGNNDYTILLQSDETFHLTKSTVTHSKMKSKFR